MTWLVPISIASDAQAVFDQFLAELERRLADPQTDRTPWPARCSRR